MPFKLIGAIIILVLVSLFSGFNIEHRCDVWLFHTFENIPVFLTILVSFIAGLVVMLPFTIGHHKKSEKKDKENKADVKNEKIDKTEKTKKKVDAHANKNKAGSNQPVADAAAKEKDDKKETNKK